MSLTGGGLVFTKEGIKALHAWTHGCLDLVFDHAEKLPQPLTRGRW